MGGWLFLQIHKVYIKMKGVMYICLVLLTIGSSCAVHKEAWQKDCSNKSRVEYENVPIVTNVVPRNHDDSLLMGKNTKIDLSREKINIVFGGWFQDSLAVYLDGKLMKRGYYQTNMLASEVISGKLRIENNS